MREPTFRWSPIAAKDLILFLKLVLIQDLMEIRKIWKEAKSGMETQNEQNSYFTAYLIYIDKTSASKPTGGISLCFRIIEN
jgi:hypothetical protein